MIDPCAFDNEKLVRDPPFQLRFYPNFNYRQAACTLAEFERDNGGIPEAKEKLVDRVMQSIARDGMRNPLIIEWMTDDPHKPVRWLTSIGNNRWLALDRLGVEGCEALVIHPTVNGEPDTQLPELSGDYEVLPFMAALARFDATYPWWNSHTMRKFCPSLVPRCL